MFKKTVSSFVLVAVLSGCSGPFIEPYKKGVLDVDESTIQTTRELRRGKPLEASDPYATIQRINSPWLPVERVDKAAPVINEELSRQVVVNRSFRDVQDVAAYITYLTGIHAQIDNLGKQSGTATQASSANDEGQYVMYEGHLTGLLDILTARFGMFWEWRDGGIYIFKTKTQTFRLAALPGDTSLTSSVGSKSGGDSSGGSSSGSSGDSEMRAGVNISGLSIWTAIENGIKAMLSSEAIISASPATGTITITDTPPVLRRVDQFIKEQNESLSRQVVLNVRVLAVDLDRSNEYGINWETVYENLNQKIGIDVDSGFGRSGEANNFTFRVLSGSAWDGSSAIIDALSKQGRVSQVTSASLVTINNQPAPIQVGRQTGYLASSTTTVGTGGSGNTVTLVPGKVTSGFSMSVLPHILDGNRLMLQYSGDISSLRTLSSISSGGSTIQTPDMDVRNFLQRVILRSGEFLVIAGFEQFNLSGKTQGVGDSENILLGGGANTSKLKSIIVVLIQPVLLSGK
jgi:type IVB pilus formation R64 PilN family outer membrane protein